MIHCALGRAVNRQLTHRHGSLLKSQPVMWNPPITHRTLPNAHTGSVMSRTRRTSGSIRVFGAGGGIRTHAVPGWKPGAFPLGDARSRVVQGVGGEPTTSRLSIARSAN